MDPIHPHPGSRQRLLQRGDVIRGFDHHKQSYDPALKQAPLACFIDHPNYSHRRANVANAEMADHARAAFKPQRVVNLATQTGARYSIQNPRVDAQGKLVGSLNILEGSFHRGIEHPVYAPSSSVYGGNRQSPFAVEDVVGHPLSLHPASQKKNELAAHTCSHLYGIQTTGLRLFTVDGPCGRPDVSPILFADRITRGEPIDVFNHGNHSRDFTAIDDIVEAVIRKHDQPATPDPRMTPQDRFPAHQTMRTGSPISGTIDPRRCCA